MNSKKKTLKLSMNPDKHLTPLIAERIQSYLIAQGNRMNGFHCHNESLSTGKQVKCSYRPGGTHRE